MPAEAAVRDGGAAGEAVRVLVAEAQALLRESLCLLLNLEPGLACVGDAADGPAAVALARQRRPDVVLTDVRLPRLDGPAVIAAVRRDVPAARVLVLASDDDDASFCAAMRAGASGFLLKDIDRSQLASAIRGVATGNSLLHPTLTARLIAHLPHRPPPGDRLAAGALTERETEVLLLLSRGLSNAEIARALVVGEATVKTHVAAVLSKLGVRSRLQAVVTAYECGVVQTGTPVPRVHAA
jgi:DNA-binding NarL/FixJ family response regulator